MPRNQTPSDDHAEKDMTEDSGPAFPPIPTPPEPPPIPELLTKPVDHPAASGRTQKSSGSMADIGRAWGMAMNFIAMILVSLGIGYAIDRWQNSSPKFTLIGMAVGFIGALWTIIRQTQAQERREQQARNNNRNP